MRSSRQDTEKHRQAIIDAAARLVREKGFDDISVPELMAQVGMTHGGFYRHFDSKEALAPLAFARAFGAVDDLLEQSAASHSADPNAALGAFLAQYLSVSHRDAPGAGCATSALAGDMARATPGCVAQRAYVDGVSKMAQELEEVLGEQAADTHQQALATLSTMVGALVLSRATRGSAISEELLEAALQTISPKPQ